MFGFLPFLEKNFLNFIRDSGPLPPRISRINGTCGKVPSRHAVKIVPRLINLPNGSVNG